jgi:hypothetical protein
MRSGLQPGTFRSTDLTLYQPNRLKFCEYASHLQTFRSFVFYKSSAICSQRHRLCMHLALSERIYSQHQRQRSAMGCHVTPGIRVWKGCIRCSQPAILRCVLLSATAFRSGTYTWVEYVCPSSVSTTIIDIFNINWLTFVYIRLSPTLEI